MMPLHWVAAITLPFLRNVEGTVMKGLKRRGWESVTWASRKFCLLSWEPLQKKKKKKSKLVYHQEKSGHLRYRRQAMVRYFNISLPPSWVSQVEVISAQHPEDGMTV